MLNLKLEVDLKLSQAEKARFASEKEQADKNAFYSELERAEKASSTFEKKASDISNKKEPEQSIGGNLHKPQQVSEKNADLKTEKNEKVTVSKGKPEQEIGGNLSKPVNESDETERKHRAEYILANRLGVEHNAEQNTAKDNSEQLVVKDSPEQQIGGNLHPKNTVDNDLADDVDTSETILPGSDVVEQSIGGNLRKDTDYFTSDVTQPQQAAAANYNVQSTDPDEKTVVSSSDKLLAQIQASNSQVTDVKQHLAPVPKALKDVLSLYQGKDEVVENKGDKKIDNIAPPALNPLKTEETTSVSTNSESVSEKAGKKSLDQILPIKNDPQSASNALPGKTETVSSAKSGKTEIETVTTQGAVKVNNTPEKPKSTEALLTTLTAQVGKNESVEIKNKGQQSGPVIDEKSTKFNKKVDNETLNPQQSVKSETSKISSVQIENAQQVASPSSPNIKQIVEEQNDNKVSISAEAQVVTHLDKVNRGEEKVTLPIEKAVNLMNKSEVSNDKLAQQIKALPAQEKAVLQQSLQQAVDSGKLNDVQLKRAEDALALLAANSELPNSDAKKSVNLMANLPNQSQSQGQSKSFTDLTSYNSTKVTAQSLSETAQSTVEQVNQESKSVFEGTEFLQVNNEQNEKPVRKTSTGSQAENIFKSIMAQPQQASTQSVHELDISQTVQQFDTALQNAQTQQNTSMGQKLSQDPNQGQVFNLQKNEVVKALHDKVNAMLMINNKEAEIRLDPPELGSMQIRIRSEAEQAQVNFVVQNQQAKEALEESMPKLKEMLAEQGIQLGESNIQQDSGSSSEQGTDEAQELGHSKLANQESQAQNSQHSNTNSSSSESGIDYYA
jgi:flagellar hook-length control protein FliK